MANLGNRNEKVRILFLAANPRDTAPIRLGEEVRLIEERLRSANFHDRFELEQHHALRQSDLAEYLLRYQPHIVHFSGHGSTTGEIVLEDNQGNAQTVPVEALRNLFAILKGNIRCIVLNACWTEPQAQAIVQEIDCVVGMSRQFDDDDAIYFSGGFYQGLAFGRDVQTAFRLGTNAIDLSRLSGSAIPHLLTHSGIDATQIFFVGASAITASASAPITAFVPHTQPVFISYSSANRPFVLALIRDLQARGVVVWIDQQGLVPGTPDWEQSLRDAIRAAASVLLIASPASRQSRYVKDELRIAEMYKQVVYPIWIEGNEWMDVIPMGWGGTQSIDARGNRYATALDEIVHVLATTVPYASPVEIPTTSIVTPKLEPETITPPRNPYKGLKAFADEDAGDFFGRDKLVNELVEALRLILIINNDMPRFMAVIVGLSGSGKSSVVMAGLLPKLHNGALPGSDKWVYLNPMVPSKHPLEQLTVAFSGVMAERTMDMIREELDNNSARGLHLLARRAANITKRPDTRLVLVIDQFEELFTLTTDENERQHFINLLVNAVTEPHGTVVAILTLRADFYDRPMQYAQLGKLVEAGGKSVLPMDLDDLRAVIEKPAALPDVHLTFDDGLVGDLLFEVRGESAPLPLLQFTLDQLFDRRDGRRLTRQAYLDIGGVKGALAKHAEKTYTELPTDEHRRLTRSLFLRLIGPGVTEQETTRRRAALSEIVLPDRDQTRLIQQCADRFINARLLTTDVIAGSRTIEVSHEALIREWKKLGEWLQEAREDIRLQQALSQDATGWLHNNKRVEDLYRGKKLSAAQEWANRNEASTEEIAFIEAAQVMQQTQEQVEREQQIRELERSQQKLALQKSATRRLGYLAVSLVLFLIVAIGLSLTALNESHQASNNAQTAVANAAQATIAQGQAFINLAEAQANATQSDTLRLAAEANGLVPQKVLINPEFAALLAIYSLKIRYTQLADQALLQALQVSRTEQAFIGNKGPLNSVSFSHDGKYVITGAEDSVVRLWERTSGRMLRRFTSENGSIRYVAFSRDDKHIITANTDGTVRVWDTDTGIENVGSRIVTSRINVAVLSADEKYVLTSGQDSVVTLWDLQTATQIRQFQVNSGDIWSVAFSPDVKTIATAGIDGIIRLWDTESGQELRELKGHVNDVWSTAFSPNSKQLASGGADATVRLWDVQTGNEIAHFSGHKGDVRSLAFSASGAELLTGGNDWTVRLWDVATQKDITDFIGHQGGIGAVAFSPDDQHILTGSDDFVARSWTIQDTVPIRELGNHLGSVSSAAFSPDGQQIVTAGEDNIAHVWNVNTFTERLALKGHTDAISSVTFSHNGKWIVTGSQDNTARMWDAQTGSLIVTLSGHTGPINHVAFSPDDMWILTASGDNTARVWDVHTGNQQLQLDGHTGIVWSAVFSPNGKQILTASSDMTARLWDIQTGHEIRQFQGHQGDVLAVAFSPNGRKIATGGSDYIAKIWDIDTGEVLRALSTPLGAVTSVDFSPDENLILTGSREWSARLWNVDTGVQIRLFGGNLGYVTNATFSSDGNQIVISSEAGIVRLWDTDYHDWLTYACHHVFRDLSVQERSHEGIFNNEPVCANVALSNRQP